MTGHIGTSNWDKFCLLMWKNWLLQWNNKLQTCLELLAPVIFMSIIVCLRVLSIPVKVTEPTVYKPVSISYINPLLSMSTLKANSSLPIPHRPGDISKLQAMTRKVSLVIAVSPNNSIIKEVAEAAVNRLGLSEVVMAENSRALERVVMADNEIAGVEFPDSWSAIKNIPKEIVYTIRFPGALRTNPDMSVVQTWVTNYIFYYYDIIGPRMRADNDGGIPPGYIREGFAAIQNAFALALIDKVKVREVSVPNIHMQRFPFPPHNYDVLLKDLEGSIAVALVLSYVFPCVCTVKFITLEKESQLKEVIKIMGLSNWLHWTAWFVKSFIMMGIPAVIIVAMFKIRWMPNTDIAIFTKSHWSTLLVVMIVYVITAVTFCFMITTFFAKANTAAAVTGLIWFILYTPYAFTVTQYETMEDWKKFMFAMISNTAICYTVKMITLLEGKGEGLQWHNVFERTVASDSMTTGKLLIMMLASSALHLLICLYVEQIFPGEFGVPKKWYYPVTKEFWSPRRVMIPVQTRRHSRRRSSLGYEREPLGKAIGIQVIDLKKQFGDKVSVDGLNLNVYHGEITVLLGHNGAGKTTTISMLIGMMQPTSGTAKIDGYDIVTETKFARNSLAICPQHNILFDDLTVEQHLIFFSKLKGVPNDEMQEEVKKYAEKLGLGFKRRVVAKKLSGGMKRKLSLGAALCGGTHIVLCDEPSSGVDPASRRQIWDLLQSEKKERTILLTTHFMDEAEVLGDRIAIMSAGKLKCFGTPFFLKKLYGNGYRLVCVKESNCDTSAVTEILRKYIPDITEVLEVGAELSYTLPDSTSHLFEPMLGELESKSKELKLNGFGISVTTLEEVFLKFGAEENEDDRKVLDEDESDISVDSIDSQSIFQQTFGGKATINMQWRAMMLKKVLSTRRNWRICSIQLIMPIIFAVLCIEVMKSILILQELPPLTISLDTYEKTTTTIRKGSSNSPIFEEYSNFIKSSGSQHDLLKIDSTDLNKVILDLAKKDLISVNRQYMVGVDLAPVQEDGSEAIIAWFNNQQYHTVPLSLNVLHNAILCAATDSSHSIAVINHPLPFECWVKMIMAQSGTGLGWHLALFICFCMTFVTSLFSIFIISERTSRAKLLQFVSGVDVAVFWITHLIWDFIVFVATVVLLLSTLMAFQQDNYQTLEEIGYHLVYFAVFGVAALCFTYFLSLGFSDAATGFTRIVILKLIGGTLIFMLCLVLRLPAINLKSSAQEIRNFAVLWPQFCLAEAITKLNLNLAVTRLCSQLCADRLGCKHVEEMCLDTPGCCLEPYFGWGYPGILPEIIYMAAEFAFFLSMTILIDYRLINNLIFIIRRKLLSARPLPTRTDLDGDVAAENRRIRKMRRKSYTQENLILKRVCKYYGGFLAVNQISVGIKEAECFGLLGVNGAGKTTTFKMMTGDEKISSGDAYLKGINLKKNMNAVYKEIGYCPQFDGLLEELTGRESMRIFCLLRGIPQKDISYVTEQLAKGFGFWKHIDKRAKVYSGGNKRKLCTAIAVLGNPAVIFLDEPTTGMDPAARRQLWNMISSIRAAGKTIVLTSHSMEECEALCTRIAIMVNGEFKCIGSSQHLKNKFSKGLVLRVKLKLPRLPEGTDRGLLGRKLLENEMAKDILDKQREGIMRIKLFIYSTFKDSYLQEEYDRNLTFYIPFMDESAQWSKIFGIIERNKHKLNIEDYSISQTTLEQIFLEFAKLQYGDTRRTSALGWIEEFKMLCGKPIP